jgi:HEPN domain-containing protein
VNYKDSIKYRLKLAEGFLKEADQDLELERYRSCVDNAQLSIENSVKAVLFFFGPVARTHNPAADLKQLIEIKKIAGEIQDVLLSIVRIASGYGMKEHFLTDYGDEIELLSPWDIFSREDAEKAKGSAVDCFDLAKKALQFLVGGEKAENEKPGHRSHWFT